MMSKTRKATFAKPSSLPTKLAIALSAVAVTPAFAADYPNHQFGLDLRTDLVFNDSDEKPNKNKEKKSSHFKTKAIRLNFQGDLTDQTAYRVRYRLNKETDPKAGGATDKDDVPDAVDYAYLTHKVNDSFSVRGGKFFWLGNCGREGDYAGQDNYLYSDGCGGIDFRTGVGLMPTFAGQSFVLSVVNGDESEANHANFGYGLTWYGDIAGGMIQPIVSYGLLPNTERKDNATGVKNADSTTNTHVAIGTRINFGSAFVEADYLLIEEPDRKENGVDEKDDETSSIVLAARVKLMDDAFQPHIKYIMDEFDDGISNKATTESYDRTGWALALEYYPDMYKDKGVNWRVHAAYWQTEKDFEMTGADKIKDSQFLVGFSWGFTNAGPKM